MVKFSIELITRGESSLEKVLQSISEQSFNSFEIVCSNSTSESITKKILSNYGVKYVTDVGIKHLKGREIAHSLSRGEVSIILDSTRPLAREALSVVSDLIDSYDMIALREGVIGGGFWVKQAQTYKEFSENEENSAVFIDKKKSYVLPRVYRKQILDDVFVSLRTRLGEEIFDSIGYGEHHLIFEEALKYSHSVCHYRESVLLYHHEDERLLAIISKYYYYGKGQKQLSRLKMYSASKLRSHRREVRSDSVLTQLKCFPLILARTLPFALGILLG